MNTIEQVVVKLGANPTYEDYSTYITAYQSCLIKSYKTYMEYGFEFEKKNIENLHAIVEYLEREQKELLEKILNPNK